MEHFIALLFAMQIYYSFSACFYDSHCHRNYCYLKNSKIVIRELNALAKEK